MNYVRNVGWKDGRVREMPARETWVEETDHMLLSMNVLVGGEGGMQPCYWVLIPFSMILLFSSSCLYRTTSVFVVTRHPSLIGSN